MWRDWVSLMTSFSEAFLIEFSQFFIHQPSWIDKITERHSKIEDWSILYVVSAQPNCFPKHWNHRNFVFYKTDRRNKKILNDFKLERRNGQETLSNLNLSFFMTFLFLSKIVIKLSEKKRWNENQNPIESFTKFICKLLFNYLYYARKKNITRSSFK